MTVIEDLLLRLRTAGASEAASSVDRVSKSVKHADTTAKSASKSHQELGKAFGGVSSMVKGAIGVAGLGGLAAGIGESIKNAESLQESQAQLGASIRANVHHPARDATKQMSEFADSLSVTGGFDPTSNIQGMTQFLRVTHDVGKAQKDMTLATNIARGAHVDLGRATRAVTMLEQGRAQGLAKLGIQIKPVTTAVDELHATYKKVTPEQLAAAKATDALATKQNAMAIVSKQYGGAMRTYSHTAAGGIANLRNTVEVLSTKLGTVLLPLVQKVTGWVSKFADQMLHGTGTGGKLVGILKDAAKWLAEVWKWIKQNKEIVEDLAIVIGTLVFAYKGWQLATEAVTAAQEALNAISDMNPWVLAIMAVVVVVILLYKHFKWFRDFAHDTLKFIAGAFAWVKNAAVDVFNWIKGHWPILAGILLGPFGFLVAEVIQNWSKVKRGFTDVIGWITRTWAKVRDVLVWPFDAAWSLIKTAINFIIDGINAVIRGLDKIHVKIPGWVPVVGGKKFGIDIAPIAHLQAGGPVSSSGPYLVGERGPEMVTLPRGAYVTPNSQLAGGDRTIVIYNILDGKQISKSVVRQGLLQQSRGG